MDEAVWIFGYGSLIWKPDFEFKEQALARLPGFERRFWQGSHDHRGIPDAPGRVVTLVPIAGGECHGIAFLIDADVVRDTFEALDHREKNGYDKHDVTLILANNSQLPGVVYVGTINNFAWLGDAPLSEMAAQIANSSGPSGTNPEYLFELAHALRHHQIVDDHVFELEAAVRKLIEPDESNRGG